MRDQGLATGRLLRRVHRAAILVTCACLASQAAITQSPLVPKSHDVDWPYYHGDPAGSHYSTLTQINRGNVHQLKLAWAYDSHDEIAGQDAASSDMEVNPIVIGGRMWIVTPKGRLICLDAATGRSLWSYDPSDQPVTTRRRLRGVSYWRDGDQARILFTFGHDLISVDAVTGLPDRSFGVAGRVDLRAGLGRPFDSISVANVTPGAVYGDLIILGSTGRLPGDVRAYDVRTGALRWSFHTIPHPGEVGYKTWPANAWQVDYGANVWAGITIDVPRGIVYLPTASPGMAARDFYGAGRLGSNRFANSLIALDAASGKLLWDFQTVHHDLWDRDLPSPPTLITVNRHGRKIAAIAQTTKSGLVFILDRVTGKPIFPVRELPVPPSDIPGEEAWPTQPFPLAPAPFARQRFSPEDVTNRSVLARSTVISRLDGLRSAGQFVPPSLQGSIIFPGLDGGAEYGGQAYDPDTGLLYINANEMAWTLALNARPVPSALPAQDGGSLYQTHCAECHGADRGGAPPVIPSLKTANRLGASAVARQILEGGGRMPGFADVLQKAQVDAIATYLITGQAQMAGISGETSETGRSELSFAVRAKAPTVAYTFAGYKRFLDPDGYPAVSPPWGTLSALDVNSGRYIWKVPLGEYPELARQGVRNTGSENYGGAVVTKGGLLFIAATSFDRKFRAIDKRTGRTLWETTLPAAGHATPATYTVDGRQFVAIAAGGGKDSHGPVAAKILAFALPVRLSAKRD